MNRRMIDSFDLTEKLRAYERAGIAVPTLNSSLMMPVYHKTEADGTEVYDYFKRVKEGQVIDTCGNVVDLAALEKQMREKMCKTFESSK